MNGTPYAIEIENLTKVYDMGAERVHALKGVSVKVEQGGFWAIMGHSGSGKSSMLQILGCLDRPTSGNYLLNGREVSRLGDDELSDVRLKYLGFVFQSFNLIPQLTVAENIALPLYYQGVGERECFERAAEYADYVGLIDRLYGTTNYRIGGWQGWTDDAEFVIDLLEEKTVRTVSVDCLSDCRSWIFFPKAVEVLYSPDGADYRSFGSREDLARSAMSDPDWNHREEGRQSTFEVTGSANCRYLKVRVKNFGKMPSWHLSAGEQAWLFIDEIGIN